MKKNVVFLFPGAWGNHNPALVRWWFERPVAALLERDPDTRLVPVVYRGNTFREIVRNAAKLVRDAQGTHDARITALCYSMGRQVFAGVRAALETDPFAAAASIAGVPARGVPLAGMLGVARVAPALLLRSLGGTVDLRAPKDARSILCSASDPALADELLVHMEPEPMWWKMAQMFVPGVRVRTPAIPTPTFVTLGRQDLLLGAADYAGDNVVVLQRPDAHHALIRKSRPDLNEIWAEQAVFLLGA